MTYGGDGAFSAVDPDNSDIAYEAVHLQRHVQDHRRRRELVGRPSPPEDALPVHQPVHDGPGSTPNHLITAGNRVHETTDGAENWETVFDLGEGEGGSSNVISAIDVRGLGTPLPTRRARRPTSVRRLGAADACPAAARDAPGTYDDTPFTIGPTRATRRATIEITWAGADNDWDMYVYKEGQDEPVGSSAQGGTTSERVVLTRPQPGDYVIRVQNYAAPPARSPARRSSTGRPPATRSSTRSAAYVAFCGYCDALNTQPFAQRPGHQRHARRQGRQAPAPTENWESFEPEGLPERYITSIQIDPSDSRVVYATLGGYSRRWLPPGRARRERATWAAATSTSPRTRGETFTDVSGEPARHPRELDAGAQRPARRRHQPRRVHLLGHERRELRGARQRAADRAGVHARAQAEGRAPPSRTR